MGFKAHFPLLGVLVEVDPRGALRAAVAEALQGDGVGVQAGSCGVG